MSFVDSQSSTSISFHWTWLINSFE